MKKVSVNQSTVPFIKIVETKINKIEGTQNEQTIAYTYQIPYRTNQVIHRRAIRQGNIHQTGKKFRSTNTMHK